MSTRFRAYQSMYKFKHFFMSHECYRNRQDCALSITLYSNSVKNKEPHIHNHTDTNTYIYIYIRSPMRVEHSGKEFSAATRIMQSSSKEPLW